MRWLVSCPSVSRITKGKLGAGVSVGSGVSVGGGGGGVSVDGKGVVVALGVIVGTSVAVSVGSGVRVGVGVRVKVGVGEGVEVGLGRTATFRGVAVGVAVSSGWARASQSVTPEPRAANVPITHNPIERITTRIASKRNCFCFKVGPLTQV